MRKHNELRNELNKINDLLTLLSLLIANFALAKSKILID